MTTRRPLLLRALVLTAFLAALPLAAVPAVMALGCAGDVLLGIQFIVGAVAFAHLLNDLIQAVLPAIYPMLKTKFALSFTQIGLVALVEQRGASSQAFEVGRGAHLLQRRLR